MLAWKKLSQGTEMAMGSSIMLRYKLNIRRIGAQTGAQQEAGLVWKPGGH